ncbi:uncharacterized protein J3D65DRAFT_661275 [Phyllosticta citribraziliensis]|uniref:Uncharacterized protein n=1 Tax=Phyllosticta citribraziliensis TaxID=989973 RepID=A0ABR1L9T1_9PEZI
MSGNPLLYSFLALLALLVFAFILMAIMDRAAARFLCCGCIWDLCLDFAANEPDPDIYPRMARFDWPRRPAPTTAQLPTFFRLSSRGERRRMIRIPLSDTTPPRLSSPIEVPDWPPPCFPQPPAYRMESDSVVNLPIYTKDPGPNETHLDELNPVTPGNRFDSDRPETPDIMRFAMIEEFSVAGSNPSSRAASPSPAGESTRVSTATQTDDSSRSPSPSRTAESNRAPTPGNIVESNRTVASAHTVES